MRIHWTQNAVEHLVNIYEYIALNSPTYARRMVDRITRRSQQIADQPLSGRKVPEYQTEDIRQPGRSCGTCIMIQETYVASRYARSARTSRSSEYGIRLMDS